MKKLAVAAMAALSLLFGMDAQQADAIVQKPEPLRIPPVILLLEDTPYYANVEKDYPGSPEGWLAPQAVQVLEGQNGWIDERNRWKIKTDSGDKWIVTEPGMFDVPPPERLTLLAETPIYSTPEDKTEPNASLSPQDVQVVGAGKLWFKTGKEEPRVWLKISTTWLGDQWVHVPIGAVGYTQIVDRKEYITGGVTVYDSPPIRYLDAKQTGEVRDRYIHVNGEFVTAFGKAYRIETDIGDKWITQPGLEIVAAKEKLELQTEMPLFSSFLDGGTQLSVLQPQTVEAFEKMGGWDAEGRTVWYHVRTAQGEGWINRSLGAPDNELPVHLDIRLHAMTALYTYPNERMQKRYEPLAAQTVRAKAYWTDEFGRSWFRIESYAGPAWLRVDPRLDTFTVPDGGPQLQIKLAYPRMQPLVQAGERVHDFNDADAGFVKDGSLYLAVAPIAQSFRYTLSEPDRDGYVTLSPETRYAFKIKEGESAAVTLWNGQPQSFVNLKAAPQLADGRLYLHEEDAKALFGAYLIRDESSPVFYLAEKEYTVEAPEWKGLPEAGEVQLHAFLYDQPEKDAAAVPRLSIFRLSESAEPSQAQASQAHAPPPPAVGDIRFRLNELALYELSAAYPLERGGRLAAALKVGERMIWQQELPVSR